MNTIMTDLMTALPELTVLSMALLILIADLFIKPQHRMITYGLSQLTLFAAALFTYQTFTGATTYAFSDLFIDDAMSDVLKLMTFLGTSLMLVYTRQYMADRNMYRGEYYAMVLFAVLGMMMMISGQHMLTIYIGLELLSLCLYALVAFDRDNAAASEAAMKYFVLGALASGMLLYGMSMVYGMTGSLNLAQISHVIAQTDAHNPVLIMGLVFIVAGLAFKFGAVPFQMWVPDVYHGSPTSITMLIGTVPKLAAFAMTIRLLAQGLDHMATDWQDMLLIMAVLSIVIGNFSALAQTNIKRMLAYSTISHVGFLLFGLMSASLNGYASSMLYISAYVLMTLAGFGMILMLSAKGFEAQELSDLKGLNERSPWFALMMMLVIFSMAGIPPFIGFYAKFTVLEAAWQAGFTWPVVLAVLTAVVGAFYYLRVVKLMYFDAPETTRTIHAPLDMKMVLSVNAIALLALGFAPQVLMDASILAIGSSL